MEDFQPLTFRAAEYQPTAPRSGDAGMTWLRLKNLILTGYSPQLYFQCYKGNLDLGETIPTMDLTGTLDGSLGSKSIVGTGTLFTTELRSGQFVFAGSDLLVVDAITDNTHLTIYKALSVALVAGTGKRMPVLFDLNRFRGTLIQGNAVEFDKGTILGTGIGTLRRNGTALDTVAPGQATNSVGTGADSAAVGTVAWTNPGNITSSGGGVASCVPTTTQITHYLKGTNCGFAIPGTATIVGIKVEIRKRINGAVTKVATDSEVKIVTAAGTIGAANKASASPWSSTLTYAVYGGPTDLWSLAWTPTDINDVDFGAVLSATVTDAGVDGSSLEVDHMRITVYYTTPTTWTLAGSPQIAIYDKTTNKYTFYTLGLTAPTTIPVITSVAGGTHGMIPGDYSLRMVPSRSATNGYGNPGPRANFTIINANDFAQVDSSLVPMDTAHGQDQWDDYATQHAANRNMGPWDFVRTVSASEGNVYPIDYLDAEIDRQGEVDFDNDIPPASGFIAVIAGAPVGVSCDGKYGGSPGPSIAPFKPQNIEAAPAQWHTKSSPPQDILGVITSQARLYFPTNASLQTGVFADTGNPLIPPIVLRSYWNVGFSNSYQAIFVANQLIGAPHSGPTRSVADAENVEEQYFGDYVAEIWRNFVGAHVLVEHDPDPNVDAVCFFCPAYSLNSSNFWTTRVLLWGLRQSAWIGDVVIESTTRDMVVCGVAKVGEHLEFLAGGRNGSGGIDVKTYRWNTVSGASVSYYAAPQLQDGGSENQNKTIHFMRATGKFTAGNMQLHGFDSVVNMSVSDIEAGTNSVSGNISLATSSDVQQSALEPMTFPNLAVFTPRISGTWDGAGDPDRIDELYLEYEIVGNRR